MATGPRPDPRPNAPSAWGILFALLACFGAAGLLHGMQPMPRDADAAYHYAVVQLIGEHGMLEAFPWERFSIVRDRYSDKELLFHLVHLPWRGLGYERSVQVVGGLLGGLWLLATWAILARERVARAWLWPLVSVAASSYFLVRFSLFRPHLLAVPLTLLVAWAATRQRLRLLFALAVVYPLAYHAFHALWVALVLIEGVRWLSTGRPAWRPAAALLAGNTLGLLLHPHFPAVLEHSWLETFQTLFASAVLGEQVPDVGKEFAPFSPAELPIQLGLPLLATAGALVGAWRARRQDPLPLAFTALAVAFGVLSLASQRFVEYFVPLATVALALAWPRHPRLPLLSLSAGLLLLAATGRAEITRLLQRIELAPPEVALALQERVPDRAHVFHCSWDTVGYVWLLLPGREAMYALNPVRFYRFDPEGYLRFHALVRQGEPAPAAVVRERYDSRYVLCDIRSDFRPFLAALEADPQATDLGRFGYWRLFDVGAPPSQREAGGAW
ncbi:hypothetical protein L6R53_07290 [Myxococcota bacterium]|nr:hypothetical protein [Myxococcota bacterium]